MHSFRIKSDVQAALKRGEAVLALESTIISHGMPFPDNVQLALELEAIACEMGVVPATIAVIHGEVCIGCETEQIEELAQADSVRKLSRADLADTIAKGDTGATTVAATMILAKAAGIDVFATGGIGGVHRGAETSFDISADLEELAQTRMVVVCAGAKAILDLPKTFERLETLGVPVIVHGSNEIPSFYSRNSGLEAPLRSDNPGDIARIFQHQSALDLPAALLITNPIPETHEIPSSEILPVIDQAIDDAEREGVQAKQVTPYLLDKLNKRTEGRSLQANIALVRNNVRLGAQIALELAANTAK